MYCFHDKTMQQGTATIIILLLFPIVLIISYSALERSKVQLKTTADYSVENITLEATHDALELIKAEGSLITDAVKSAKNGDSTTWFEGDYTISGANVQAAVRAEIVDLINTSQEKLDMYNVTIKIRLEKNGVVNETQSYYVTIGAA